VWKLRLTHQTDSLILFPTKRKFLSTQQGFLEAGPFLLVAIGPGVFAPKDVRDTSTKQVVSAAGEGSSAALII
jgi:hypothetical protein